jgi:hypothetical protein
MQYDSKLPQYFNPRKNRFFTAVIYHGKLTRYFYNIGPWQQTFLSWSLMLTTIKLGRFQSGNMGKLRPWWENITLDLWQTL